MDKFDKQFKKLENVYLKIAILQILALTVTCCIGMYMTSKEIYFEQIYLIPFYLILSFGIIKLHNKWCNKILKEE